MWLPLGSPQWPERDPWVLLETAADLTVVITSIDESARVSKCKMDGRWIFMNLGTKYLPTFNFKG